MIFVHLRIHVCYCWRLPRVFGHVLELPAEKSVFDTAYRAHSVNEEGTTTSIMNKLLLCMVLFAPT